MRSFWLALKIAAVFTLVLVIFVSLTLHLFARQVMHAPRDHALAAHDAFVATVLQFGFLAVLCVIGLALFITRPLRRLSHSMDRIAAGDLEHRIPVRGHDEVAAMGQSFNTMAARIRSMILGQKELMASVSHELRSPLTRVKLSLELMRGAVGESDCGGAADRIADLEAEIDEIDALVEELLLVSRVDLGAAPLDLEEIDLEEIIEQAWTRVAAEADHRGTTLKVEVENGPHAVLADRALVLRLLGNLFENAVLHAGEGRVMVTSTRRTDRFEITVTDEGPGVDEGDLDHLFEPFFRADRSRSRKTGAGGLGLMIVRRAVEAHGGRVQARRLDPRGLAVSFDLSAKALAESSFLSSR